METSVEVGRHVDPHSGSKHEQGEAAWCNRAREAARTEPGAVEGDARVSVDPMRSTDRYRLVLPCDLQW